MRLLLDAKASELEAISRRCNSLYKSLKTSYKKRGDKRTWNNAFKTDRIASAIVRAVPESKVSALVDAFLSMVEDLTTRE